MMMKWTTEKRSLKKRLIVKMQTEKESAMKNKEKEKAKAASHVSSSIAKRDARKVVNAHSYM